jgi:hypothetical protein
MILTRRVMLDKKKSLQAPAKRWQKRKVKFYNATCECRNCGLITDSQHVAYCKACFAYFRRRKEDDCHYTNNSLRADWHN